MKKLPIILFLTAMSLSACVFSASRDKSTSEETKPANAQNTPAEKPGAGAETKETKNAEIKADAPKAAEKTDCLSIKVSGRALDKKQTFAFDYAPFKGSCFVTTRDPEFDDPPLGSEFFIYQNGKEVFKFPNQFNGVMTGCWAEGVAFQDLNDDGLTDIIIAGMCSAKSAPYSENMVYVNKGEEFTTSEDANYTLENFTKIKEIADFVKRNPDQFFQ